MYAVLGVTVGDGIRFGLGFLGFQALALLVFMLAAVGIIVLAHAAGIVLPL